MVQVIRNGKREELANMAELKAGDSVIISGLDVNRIQFVRQWEITQVRKSEDAPNDPAVEVQVPQWHFSFSGRSFTVTGNGLEEDGVALTATIKKTAKGGARVKEVYLVANEWHPQLTDGEGNVIMDDATGQPALNMEVTNTSFTYSGQATAEQVAEEQDDQLAYEAKRVKLNLVNNEAIKTALKEMGYNASAPVVSGTN